MAEITIKFYGPARDLTGTPDLTLDLADRESLASLVLRLSRSYPPLAAVVGLRWAVNRKFAPMEQLLNDGDEIALIPPVSGGASDPIVRLTRQKIDEAAIITALTRPDGGAILAFRGIVRAEMEDARPLRALDYCAFEEMALEQMRRIRTAALESHEILDAAIVHRLGELALGEISILIAVSAAHRQPAFDACHWILEQVKRDVPIWKKDLWSDGTQSWTRPNQPS